MPLRWPSGGPRGVVFHDTGGPTLASAQATLRARGLAYNIIVDRNGNIVRYTPSNVSGAHAGTFIRKEYRKQGLGNRNMLGVAYVGNGPDDMTPEQRASARNLADLIRREYPGVNPDLMLGHGEFTQNHRELTEGTELRDLVRNEWGATTGPFNASGTMPDTRPGAGANTPGTPTLWNDPSEIDLTRNWQHPDDSAFPQFHDEWTTGPEVNVPRDTVPGTPTPWSEPDPLNQDYTPPTHNQNNFHPLDWFAGGNRPFDVQRYIHQFGAFPAGSPFGDGSGSTPQQGHVIVSGVDTGPQGELDPMDAIRESGLTGYQEQLPPEQQAHIRQQAAQQEAASIRAGGSPNSNIGIGTSTTLNARIGNPGRVMFGTGTRTGQSYFNEGRGWRPIGEASADVRWAQNSGTGNFAASQFLKHYDGGDPGNPNDPGANSEEERSRFLNGVFRLNPEGGYEYMGERVSGYRRPTNPLIAGVTVNGVPWDQSRGEVRNLMNTIPPNTVIPGEDEYIPVVPGPVGQ